MNAIINTLAALLGSMQRPQAGAAAPPLALVLKHETQSFAETLAAIAESQVGVQEEGGNNRGRQVQAYQSATSLTGTDWPWCAAFDCWVVWQAILKTGLTPRDWTRPRTALAWGLESWANKLKSGGCQCAHDEACAHVRRAERAEAEVERLTKQIKDDNRAYGCELRDPNGTIWEQAKKDHARAERAEAQLAANAQIPWKS